MERTRNLNFDFIPLSVQLPYATDPRVRNAVPARAESLGWVFKSNCIHGRAHRGPNKKIQSKVLS